MGRPAIFAVKWVTLNATAQTRLMEVVRRFWKAFQGKHVTVVVSLAISSVTVRPGVVVAWKKKLAIYVAN